MSAATGTYEQVSLGAIVPSTTNPRKSFDDAGEEALGRGQEADRGGDKEAVGGAAAGREMSREIVTFDPDTIQAALDRNLAAGLRMVADALDCGMLDGRCIDARGHGFTSNHDARAHVLVRLDLAAPVLTIQCGKKALQLPEPSP